jgi:hypothetical protein
LINHVEEQEKGVKKEIKKEEMISSFMNNTKQ